jgi:hypothetical protein
VLLGELKFRWGEDRLESFAPTSEIPEIAEAQALLEQLEGGGQVVAGV